MKRERSFVEKRRMDICQILQQSPEIKVYELAELFHVSLITIRRDLQALEEEKKLTRFYGGAKLYPEEEMDELSKYRYRIAQEAASYIKDGDSVFFNTSSNVLQILEFLEDRKNVTIITNNGKAIYQSRPPGVQIVLTGGELRYPKETMVGEYAERSLRNVFAKKAFIGCSGLSCAEGMTTENANEVNLNKLMLKRITGEAYILASHTKIGHRGSFRTCGIDKISHVITDEKASKEEVTEMRKQGITIQQVSLI